jgi:RNA polymerase sigma-70 factor (ECF subfamily)
MSPQVDTIAPSLLIRIQNQEAAAWSRLVFLFSPLVSEWVKKSGVPERDVSDIVQEVFIGVMQSAPEFRRDLPGATFRGWLRRIAHYKAIDYHRRGKQVVQPTGGSEANLLMQMLPEEVLEDEELETSSADLVVRRGLELIQPEFTAKTWQAFQLVAVREKPAAEVAQELGMSVGAVYIAKSRVMNRLRKELEGLI